jgi:5-methylcytosine-specific restriction endonuclease McrA
MPMRAASICPCGHRVPAGTRCACAVKRARESEAKRPSASARGYTASWSKESKAFLALPGNERCACGCGRVANMVDHIRAPKGDQAMFWDRSNWQPFNLDCNRRKAIASEGGFGRPIGLRPAPANPIHVASTPGRVETLPKGPLTAWGQSREISPNSDRGGNSR